VTFVVEDGFGVEGANAYAPTDYVTQYHADRGRTDWALASATAMEAAIVRATSHVDRVFGSRFTGFPSSPSQSLEWPRIDAFDVYGNSIVFSEDLEFSEDAISVSTVTDTLTFGDDHELVTGDGPVQIDTTGTLPGGLLALTDYWVVRTSTAAISLAESHQQAMEGDVVDITSVGVGTHTVEAVEGSLHYSLPEALKRAISEYALQAYRIGELTPNPPTPVQQTDLGGIRSGSVGVKRTKVGPIEIETSDAVFSTLSTGLVPLPRYPDGDYWLSKLLHSSSGVERW
jgi:hypothetical protein